MLKELTQGEFYLCAYLRGMSCTYLDVKNDIEL